MAFAGLCYGIVVCVAYLQVTSSSSLWPDVRSLDAVFFGRGKAIGTIERLLESSEGPMNRAGTMRPAFTKQSDGWESLTQNMTADEKSRLVAERDGERLALLAWVRSGLNQQAYEADDFPWDNADAVHPITSAYLAVNEASETDRAKNVRIRSIVTDRCVSCHGENGRHELARWIPLDSYENVERHCRPEADSLPGTKSIIAAIVGLILLGLMSGPVFYATANPLATRGLLTILPLAAVVVAGGSWIFGRPGSNAIYVLVGAASVAAIGVTIQIVASVAELLSHQERP